jgi:hypothetical protein
MVTCEEHEQYDLQGMEENMILKEFQYTIPTWSYVGIQSYWPSFSILVNLEIR